MAYQVINGSIQPNVLYSVIGTQSVIYSGVEYFTGDTFRGIINVSSFTYSGSGTQEINEVVELIEGGLEFIEDATTQPLYSDGTNLKGFSIEYQLTEAERVVQETTRIQGYALELIDYPFYSFEIIEIRL